jgi:RimJ/RimL family protein N-acetyltransferase
MTTAAGTIGSRQQDGQQLLGYWVGREWWGRGVDDGIESSSSC